ATLVEIGNRAHVSPGLIAHYFDDKDGLLEATLRSLAARLARGVSVRLPEAPTPRERIQAVIAATLAPEEFDPKTSSVWLAFWGQVLHSARLKRVQEVYQRRVVSNLRHALCQLVPSAEARRLAIALAAMIDGLWLRAARPVHAEIDSSAARAIAGAYIDRELAAARDQQRPSHPVARASAASSRIRNHIGGAYVDADAGTFTSINPATGEVLAEIEVAGEAEVDRAVEAARAGQARWAAMTGSERGRVLRRAADLLR